MKKLILSTTFLIAGTLGILAQGLVLFDNYPANWSDGIDRNVYADRVGGTLLDNPTYQAGLFENQGGNWVQLGDLASFDWGGATIPGCWLGGDRSIGVAPGVATSLQVRIFDATGNFLAQSDPFSYTHKATIPAPTDATYMDNFRAFAVPEPSTVALGVLGLGALLLFRRRK